MAVPTARSTEDTAAGLTRFLEQRTAWRDVDVIVLPSPSGTGFSSETILFDAVWTGPDGRRGREECVARVEPQGYGLYQAFDLEAQWKVIEAVGRTGRVPVPRIVAHATGADDARPDWLGKPFFVMQRVAGQAAADAPPYTVRGWLAEAAPEAQRRVFVRGLDVLVEIHRIDWRALGLEFLQGSGVNPVGVRAQLEHDQGFAAAAADIGTPPQRTLCRAALSWLAEHLPDEDAHVLTWGDARLGNLLFRGTEPVAVLDWEMATLSMPAADVAWYLVFDLIHSVGIGRPGLPGFPSHAEAVEYYERESGRPLTGIEFFKVRAALRGLLLLMRYSDYLQRVGRLAADATRTPATPAEVVLTRLLEGSC